MITMASSAFPDVQWPEAFLLFNLQIGFAVNLDFLSLPSIGCLAQTNYIDRFLTYTFAIGGLLGSVMILRSLNKCRRKSIFAKHIQKQKARPFAFSKQQWERRAAKKVKRRSTQAQRMRTRLQVGFLAEHITI